MAKEASKSSPKKTRSAAVKKAAVKKTAVKKTAVKKAPVKKAAVKKTPVKKVATKKVAAKKVTKKAATKKIAKKAPEAVTTTIIAKVDAGFGNEIYLRGSSSGLTWDKGVLMENRGADEWAWSSNAITSEVEFKVLLNDEQWSEGPNGVVFPGATVVFEPAF